MTDKEIMQRILNIAVPAVVKQGCPSVDLFGICRYRGPDGTKCPIGYIIKDKYYYADLEGKSVEVPPVKEVFFKSLGIDWTETLKSPPTVVCFMISLQQCHDSVPRQTKNSKPFVDSFIEKVLELVKIYDLEMPHIDRNSA